jgi:hypothetical protein
MQRWTPPAAQAYVVPTYTAPDDTSWYHFLHGNVPRHQIDFIYRPVVPQARLSQQHFSHLSRLMKYIEPHTYGGYAFCIGNLSRDDVQYEPGHGGIALIFSMRILGATDHAGRPDPPFTHAIAAIDRELTPASLLQAAMSFHRHMQFDTDSEAAGRGWYHTYARCAMENPAVVENVLQAYIADFEDLPPTGGSAQGAKWTAAAASLPKRVVIVRPSDCPFEDVAWCAARIAAMLYRSDIRWTSITNGREADIPNGVSIRIVAQQEAGQAETGVVHFLLSEVPENESELAAQIFNAKPVSSAEAPAPVQPNWRELYQASKGSAAGAPAAAGSQPGDMAAQERAKFPSTPPPRGEPSPSGDGEADPFRGQVADEIKRFRERRMDREETDHATPTAPDGHRNAAGQPGAPAMGQYPGGGLAAPALTDGASPSHRAAAMPLAGTLETTTREPAAPQHAPRIWPWVVLGISCIVGLLVAYVLLSPTTPPAGSTSADSAGVSAGDPPKTAPSPPGPAPSGEKGPLSGDAPPTAGDKPPAAEQSSAQPPSQGAAPAGTSPGAPQPAPAGTGKKPVKKDDDSVFGGKLKLGGAKKP